MIAKEKRRLTVYGHVPLDIKNRKRIDYSEFYVGSTTELGRRIRNHLLLTKSQRGAKKTRKWVLKYGSITPVLFITGFTKFRYALSFEKALQTYKLPKHIKSSVPITIRRLIHVLHKKTWSVNRPIPDAITLPKLTIHWIRPEFKPNPSDYYLDFPTTHIRHIHLTSYSEIDNIILNNITNNNNKVLKKLIQNCLHLNT